MAQNVKKKYFVNNLGKNFFFRKFKFPGVIAGVSENFPFIIFLKNSGIRKNVSCKGIHLSRNELLTFNFETNAILGLKKIKLNLLDPFQLKNYIKVEFHLYSNEVFLKKA